MSVFEEKTLKPNRSWFWVFAPIVALVVIALLFFNFITDTGFSWNLFLLVVAGLVALLIIWKLITYFRSNDSEVREYEKEMKKLGRR